MGERKTARARRPDETISGLWRGGAKWTPDDLESGTTYYDRFQTLGVQSPIGRTSTLPVNHVDRLRLDSVVGEVFYSVAGASHLRAGNGPSLPRPGAPERAP